jgi:hypothetical protein
MNCDEVFGLLEQEAPTKEKCKTKSELRLKAENRLSGISGSRINVCLEQLQGDGRAKKYVKCVQTCDCYYDPPTTFDWRPVLLLVAVASLGVLIWQAGKRCIETSNLSEEYVPIRYTVVGKSRYLELGETYDRVEKCDS